MLLPLSWLKEYVDIEDITPIELENRLFESGFEVEEKKYLGAEIENCVVGQIKQITKHPDSDHLQICQMDIGKDELVQIVTGAQNVFEGALVPAALDDNGMPIGMQFIAPALEEEKLFSVASVFEKNRNLTKKAVGDRIGAE